jgi:hypothetical protein
VLIANDGLAAFVDHDALDSSSTQRAANGKSAILAGSFIFLHRFD